MASSLASRLAATLPSQQASAPGTSAPQAAKETIPKSLAHAVDVEAETPLEQVRLDGLVVTKIIKHGRDNASSNATGVLLGIDLQGSLEVSNSFPLPSKGSGGDEEGGGRDHTRYQTQMLRQLSFVSGDTTIVGSYHTVSMGQYFKQFVIDSLVGQIDRVRHGGIALVHDVSQSARGNASFKAFRLSPGYLAAKKSGKFNATSLIENQLTFKEILIELPVIVRNSPLASAFLNVLRPVTGPSYTNLSLPPPTTSTRALESLIDALDASKSEENNLAYLSRQIAREKSKVDAFVAKRKEENTIRVAQGLPALPEEDVTRMFKVPPEPPRMESMLLFGQVDAVAKELEGLAGTELVKMYAARAG